MKVRYTKEKGRSVQPGDPFWLSVKR